MVTIVVAITSDDSGFGEIAIFAHDDYGIAKITRYGQECYRNFNDHRCI